MHGAERGIVERKCVRVGRARGPRDDERIATQEAADDRVVDARTEVDDAEVGEEVAAVPLLGRVEEGARCGWSRGGFSERPIADVLDERVRIVGRREPRAALFAEREHEGTIRAAPTRANPGNLAHQDRLGDAIDDGVAPLDQPVSVIVPRIRGALDVEPRDLA